MSQWAHLKDEPESLTELRIGHASDGAEVVPAQGERRDRQYEARIAHRQACRIEHHARRRQIAEPQRAASQLCPHERTVSGGRLKCAKLMRAL